MGRRWQIALAVLAAALLYLLFWPVPIDPAAWTPPPAPTLGANRALAAVERLPVVHGIGPETVAIDAQGLIYAGLTNGDIVRLTPDGRNASIFADTGGRPLGMTFDAAGDLLVADAHRGLLSISPAREVRELAREASGEPILFANDVDVSADGVIYLTDTSRRFPLEHSDLDFIEHRGTGRLIELDPRSGAARVVARDLHYPNGVAVAPDGSFVVVTESTEYRVRRYWRRGPRAGQLDTFIDNLPGFPTGISSNGRDTFWLALAFPRIGALDALLPHPFLRKVVFRLPDFVKPAPARRAMAFGLSLDGRVVRDLQDDSEGAYAPLTSVEEHDGALYLAGGFQERWQPAIARIRLPR